MSEDTHPFLSSQVFPTNSNIPYALFCMLLEYYRPEGIPYSFFTLLAFIFIKGLHEDDLVSSSRLVKKKSLLGCFSNFPFSRDNHDQLLTEFWVFNTVISKRLEYITHILNFSLSFRHYLLTFIMEHEHFTQSPPCFVLRPPPNTHATMPHHISSQCSCILTLMKALFRVYIIMTV